MAGTTDIQKEEYEAGNRWTLVYTLDKKRHPVSGSEQELTNAIRRGADLRIYTEFRHNEHIDRSSTNAEIVQEVSDFRVTYLLEDRWVAGIMNLRQPISLLGEGFGPRPSMSFFMYNQNGLQSIARPYLDGKSIQGEPGPSSLTEPEMDPNYHYFDLWDDSTNAPSHNFVYDFEVYRFYVLDVWKEVLSHGPNGEVLSGSVEALAEECSNGRDVKLGIRGLCADLDSAPDQTMEHEVFVHGGPNYYYTEQNKLWAGTHPVIRVKPDIPIQYQSKGWDFGWLVGFTDGHVARWLVDPYTLKFEKSQARYALRWFVR